MTQTLEAKIVVLGSLGVGKTSLVSRYVSNRFLPSPSSTVGASFLTKRLVDTDTNTSIKLQIWDTAGQERFRSISRLYYRGANACILCYSVVDAKSFEEMKGWLEELRREGGEGGNGEMVLHVVGTKVDLAAREPAKREVPFERCIAYVAEHLAPGLASTPPATASGLHTQTASPFFGAGAQEVKSPASKRSSGFWGQEVGWDCCHEVSAESGEGVDEVFRVVTRKLVDREMRRLQESAVPTPMGETPGIDGGEGGGYFEGRSAGGRPGMGYGGSFRVGRDRRSWLGFPPGDTAEVEPVVGKPKGKCC